MQQPTSAHPPVVLVAMPPWSIDVAPIGVAYVSRYLRHKGVETRVVDLNHQFYYSVPEESRHIWEPNFEAHWFGSSRVRKTLELLDEQLDRGVESILAHDPRIVGISVCGPKQAVAIELIRRLKRAAPDLHVVLGGVACSSSRERSVFLDQIPELVTGFVEGEGEETFHEVVLQLRRDDPQLDEIKSFVHPHGAQGFGAELAPDMIRAPLRMDDVPFPDYAEFDMDRYSRHLSVEMCRGCIGNCTYCAIKRLYHGLRQRSPEHVFAELEHHHRQFNAEYFIFVDSLMNSSIKLLDRLCDRIIDSGLRFEWHGHAIPRKEMTAELLHKMRAAGCTNLAYGLESGSTRVLELMRKIFTAEQAERVIRETHEAGIETMLYLITGYPGEQEDEFQQTLDFLRRNHESIDRIRSINMVYLMHDTYLFDNRHELGIELPPMSEGYHWVCGENTVELRGRRVETIRALVKELGIPSDLHSTDEIALEDPQPDVAIIGVLITDDHGRAGRPVPPGSQLSLSIHYVVNRQVQQLMFRIQIFRVREEQELPDLFVFGSNTARFQLQIPARDVAAHAATLALSPLNLQPGRYRCSLGIWPAEESEQPYHAYDGAHEFYVAGPADCAGGLARMPHRWAVDDTTASAGTARLARPALLSATAADGTAPLRTGEPARAVVDALLKPDEAVRAILTHGDEVVFVATCDERREGWASYQLSVDTLNVLGGDYELTLAIAAGDEEREHVTLPMTVVSRRMDGAGLVFSPATWTLCLLHPPKPWEDSPDPGATASDGDEALPDDLARAEDG